MIPAKDEFILDLSASCTVDQAVLRLVGWVRDTVYLPEFDQIGDGNFVKNLLLTFEPDFSLQGFLSELYKQAILAFSAAVPNETNDEDAEHALDLHVERIEETHAFFEKARSYKMDIVDELAKGETSALRLDKEAMAQMGKVHITIRSLDAWSESTYAVKKDVAGGAPESDLQNLLEKLEDVDGTKKSDLGLYVTLALAVKAFAEKAGGKFNTDGAGFGVNVLQVSEHFASLGTKQRAKDSNLHGQSVSAIRARIKTALDHYQIVQRH